MYISLYIYLLGLLEAGGMLAIHQFISRGIGADLCNKILTEMDAKLGSVALAELLNTGVGRNGYDACVLALKTNLPLVPIVKRFGGREGRKPPEDWVSQRRRNPDRAEWDWNTWWARETGNAANAKKSKSSERGWWAEAAAPSESSSSSWAGWKHK